MLSFLEIGILLLCTGILLFLFSLTSFHVKVSGEKKQPIARSGIDYVIVSFHNYFSPPSLIRTQQEYKYTTQYNTSGLRYRKEGGASSMHLPTDEKEKIV